MGPSSARREIVTCYSDLGISGAKGRDQRPGHHHGRQQAALSHHRRLRGVRARHHPPLDAMLKDAVPVLHGPLGEDGSVQGLAELAGVP